MVRTAFGTLALLLVSISAQAQVGIDEMDLSQAAVFNSPGDVASWPVTTAITELHMRPNGVYPTGISLVFSGQQTWPDYLPPGWSGSLQYTVWAVVRVNGQWCTSGFIQMWRGRSSTGAPILSDFAINWAYDARWGPMNHYQPQVGELMGFFVTAGDARGVRGVTSVRERSNVVLVNLPANDTGDFYPWRSYRAGFALGDADGDRRADLAVFRPGGGLWYARASSTNYATSAVTQWGLSGDVPLICDFDGDRKSDLTLFRPTTGQWFVRYSSLGYSSTTYWQVQWGLPGDVPLCADFDGDGRADLTVYRPSIGTWFVLYSSLGYNVANAWYPQWGLPGDIPIVGDFDRDGKTDLTVYRPSTGEWFVRYSSLGYSSTYFWRVQWGIPGDIPLAADFDRDGGTELTVFRPSTGEWFVRYSTLRYDPNIVWRVSWGLPGDVPVVADFDGDGGTELTIFRPATGEWYIRYSSSNYSVSNVGYYQWGTWGDTPPTR
jgi:hypothetical protein